MPARDDAGRNEVPVERAVEFPVHARIEAQLTGPGAPFETVVG